MIPAPRKTLPLLTAARFFASILNICHHFAQPIVAGGTSLPSRAAQNLFSNGWAGVTFFFVLSGYVLTWSVGDKTIDRKAFYWARFARLYPLLFVSLVLDVPFVVGSDPGAAWWVATKLAVATFVNFLLLQAWILPFTIGWNAPSWTLSCEAFFYALFPTALECVRNVRQKAGRRAVWAVWLAVALVSAGVTLNTHLRAPEEIELLGRVPVLNLASFFLGMVLCETRAADLLKGRPLMRTILIVGPCLSVCLPPSIASLLRDSGLLSILAGGLIVALAESPADSLLAAPMRSKPMLILGEASYGMYILQSVVFHCAQAATSERGLTWFLVTTGVLVAVSLVSVTTFEVTARRWILRRFVPA